MKNRNFSFLLSSVSTFDAVRGTNKREQYKMKKQKFFIFTVEREYLRRSQSTNKREQYKTIFGFLSVFSMFSESQEGQRTAIRDMVIPNNGLQGVLCDLCASARENKLSNRLLSDNPRAETQRTQRISDHRSQYSLRRILNASELGRQFAA